MSETMCEMCGFPAGGRACQYHCTAPATPPSAESPADDDTCTRKTCCCDQQGIYAAGRASMQAEVERLTCERNGLLVDRAGNVEVLQDYEAQLERLQAELAERTRERDAARHTLTPEQWLRLSDLLGAGRREDGAPPSDPEEVLTKAEELRDELESVRIEFAVCDHQRQLWKAAAEQAAVRAEADLVVTRALARSLREELEGLRLLLGARHGA